VSGKAPGASRPAGSVQHALVVGLGRPVRDEDVLRKLRRLVTILRGDAATGVSVELLHADARCAAGVDIGV
jgi:hypothetical protein